MVSDLVRINKFSFRLILICDHFEMTLDTLSRGLSSALFQIDVLIDRAGSVITSLESVSGVISKSLQLLTNITRHLRLVISHFNVLV